MKWRDQAEAYQGRATEQSTEAMVVRRIWKGMGYSGGITPLKLANAEVQAWGHACTEKLDIERIMDLFNYGLDGRLVVAPWQCVKIQHAAELNDQVAECAETNAWLWVRVSGASDDIYVCFVPKFHDMLMPFGIKPPFTVTGSDTTPMICQEAVLFVSNFRPYSRLLS